jgi:hypothetical protein
MSNEQVGRGKEREADTKRGTDHRKCVKIKCGRGKGQLGVLKIDLEEIALR